MAFKNQSDYIAYHANYRAKNRHKLKIGSRKYRELHPEIELAWRPQYLTKNAEVVKVRKADYYIRTKEERNKESRRNYFKKKYGILPEQKEAMLVAQNRLCAICKAEVNMRTGHLDHCHEPFQIREILCGRCNPGLGNFRDNPELLEKAATYLRRHHPKHIQKV